MPRIRKHYSAEFKARVALEAIRGERTISEIASTHSVHPNQVTQWKKLLEGEASALFGDKRVKDVCAAADQAGASTSVIDCTLPSLSGFD